MKWVLLLGAMLAGFVGFVAMALGRTSIQEIYGALFLCIGAILFGAAAIVEAVDRQTEMIREAAQGIHRKL